MSTGLPEPYRIRFYSTLVSTVVAKSNSKILTRLIYDPQDILAIKIEFHSADGQVATWVISVDLFLAGLRSAVGELDVRLLPEHRKDRLWMMLATPKAPMAKLTMPLGLLREAAFRIDAMRRRLGEHTERLINSDLDATLKGILEQH